MASEHLEVKVWKRRWSLTGDEPHTPNRDEKEKEYATLTLPDGSTYQLEILDGTCGPKAIDIRNLYDTTGLFTYDPGFTSTCSCHSSITYIDGNVGRLLYRGYEIQELAEHCTFEEVSYLILYGHLPNTHELDGHSYTLKYHSMVHEKLLQFFTGFKSDAHPMAIMVGVVGALSSFYHEAVNIHNPLDQVRAAYRLIAKMPTIAAIAYKTAIGQPHVYPQLGLSVVENFLYMMFAVPSEPYYINPVMVHALQVWMILHMDHEQNASTSTVRIAGSSFANPYACIASGITTLWGPAHGGANEAVLEMLTEIGSRENIPSFLEKVKNKQSSVRLMGFGHRVYKNYDPRAKIMREVCFAVLRETAVERDALLELAIELEGIALEDEYFIKRKLYPNVDFYSGIMLKAMGIPVSMFTVLFAVARTVGWVTHWKEMISDPKQKIGRPRQLFVGPRPKSFVNLADRPLTDDAAVFSEVTYSVQRPRQVGRAVGAHLAYNVSIDAGSAAAPAPAAPAAPPEGKQQQLS